MMKKKVSYIDNCRTKTGQERARSRRLSLELWRFSMSSVELMLSGNFER